jgi:hypothetical protein
VKRLAGIIAALGIFGVVLVSRMSYMNVEEKPLPLLSEHASAAGMLAAVKGAPARPAHTELASFAAG